MKRRTVRSRQASEAAGRRAESYAAWFLRLRGYRILAQRYRTRSGEIDLVARKKRTLVFIEVKLRSREKDGENPVTAHSEERILRAGEVYLSRHPRFVDQGYALRYDLLVVIQGAQGRWKIDHRKDAFRGW